MTRAEQALQGLSDYKLNFFILPEDPIPLMRWVTSECGYGAVVEIDSLRAKRLLRYVAQQLAEWILKGLEEVSP